MRRIQIVEQCFGSSGGVSGEGRRERVVRLPARLYMELHDNLLAWFWSVLLDGSQL